MKKLLVAVALTLSVAACAEGSKSSWQQTYGRTFYEPDAGMAAVYIIRDDPGQDATPINVTMGRHQVVSLTGLSWTRLNLPPSFYDFRAYGAQGSSELVVTVNAGQSRFFLAAPKAPDSAELLELSQGDGRRLVRKGQVVANTP